MNYQKLESRCLLVAALLGVGLAPAGLWAAPTVYIAGGDADQVLVVDSADNRVTAEIGGVKNTHGLAADASGRVLLAGSLNPRESEDVPEKPAGMSDDEHSAHHGTQAGGTAEQALARSATVGTVYQIDTAQRRILRQINVPGFVHHTLVTADGRYGIATHPTTGGISVIDMQSGELMHHLATGPVPSYAVASADGSRVWVSNSGNDTVSEIDTGNWIVRRNLIVGRAPEHMALAPDGASLYVVENGDGTIAELDVASGETVNRYPVGNDPHGIDFSDDGTQLFASAREDEKLVAIDLNTGDVRTLTLAPAPYHLAAVDGTGNLYVSSRESPLIWVVSQEEMKVLGEIPIRGVGHQMVVTETR
jgi:YVTN family beta-propeller protein